MVFYKWISCLFKYELLYRKIEDMLIVSQVTAQGVDKGVYNSNSIVI